MAKAETDHPLKDRAVLARVEMLKQIITYFKLEAWVDEGDWETTAGEEGLSRATRLRLASHKLRLTCGQDREIVVHSSDERVPLHKAIPRKVRLHRDRRGRCSIKVPGLRERVPLAVVKFASSLSPAPQTR